MTDFELKEKIYGTSMSQVWIANWSGQEIIVKFLPRLSVEIENEELKKKEEVKLRRFYREIKILKSMEDPHVVEIFFHSQPGEEKVYYGMEFLRGGDLKQKLAKGGRMSWQDVWKMMQGVFQTLQKFHEKEGVHRDIKLANFLLTADGRVKISDFGLSRLEGLSNFQEVTKMAQEPPGGTLAYSPPEMGSVSTFPQNLPQWQKVDIYALGVSLYELLTGELPFQGSTGWEIMYKISNGQFLPPHEKVRDIPQTVSDIICKMMASEPEQRYKSMKEVNQTWEEETKKLNQQWEVRELFLDPVSSWPCEEGVEELSAKIVEEVTDLQARLNYMNNTRRSQAYLMLAHYAQKQGRWEEASQWYSSGNFYPQKSYLKFLQEREHAPKEWLVEQKQDLQKKIWEEEYSCRKCKKPVTLEQLREHKAVVVPCRLKRKGNSNVYRIFFYHNCCVDKNLVLAEDWYGEYSLHCGEQKNILVHKVPFSHENVPSFSKLLERYKRGIHLASQLKDCPWVLSIENSNPVDDENWCYFYLQNRPALSLKDCVRRKYRQLSQENLYFILFELARALEVFAAVESVHRFLSPRYIFIDVWGSVYLSGFHLAKSLSEDNTMDHWQTLSFQHSQEETLFHPFSSPEHVKGFTYIRNQTDVWSWGVIAYQLLTRTSVYGTADPRKIREKLLAFANRKEVFLYPKSGKIPDSLNTIIANCLKLSMAERYTPTKLVSELAKFIHTL